MTPRALRARGAEAHHAPSCGLGIRTRVDRRMRPVACHRHARSRWGPRLARGPRLVDTTFNKKRTARSAGGEALRAGQGPVTHGVEKLRQSRTRQPLLAIASRSSVFDT